MFANLKDQRPKTKDQRLRAEKGFTLIELSIVIVLIGLIVAGVVGGQALVQQAQVRIIINDYSKYSAAINTFYLEYNSKPGDMRNAFDYWGSNCSLAGTAIACNGNGNKEIHQTTPGLASDRQEAFMAWRHMNLAGILPGMYDGVGNAGNNHEAIPGVNVPETARGGGWHISTNSPWMPTNHYPVLEQYERMMVGKFRVNSYVDFAIFSPSEAHGVDVKLDDGMPLNGQVQSVHGSDFEAVNEQCITGTTLNATYTLSQEGERCILWFNLKI
ncbi:MAG: hypothetical protein COV35_07090 [Alphaproteobacteria bacterium CG11_big_fil_rev_8_21_14_0_20_39_49]|nr:MAG: hypothetical protein COV35_07090 [Alphaproteobacteria bacterium CG11_big_fil_rev_8_21_14_0_20_39_49]